LGPHILTIELAEQALDARRRGLRNVLSRDLAVEVRLVESQSDRFDHALNRSFLAMQSQRYGEARVWANRVLAEYPNSISALVDLAESWRAEGRCADGIPALQRAADIVATNADPLRIRPLPQSYAETLLAMIGRCQREAANR
jgi:tetratricopeptide (TPR) repeat protein